MVLCANLEKCNGCHACASICPKGCITMQRNEEGFLYPQIAEQACVQCGLCEKVCPIEKACPPTEGKPIAAYAAMHKDSVIRENSSSGGIFTAIATYVLKEGGVVFGAAFDEAFNVVHTYVEDIENLYKLRGSKYVQSTIGNSYQQAEDFLKQGRVVLFTGTPCQIGGLHAYLGKSYEHLITQDIICHGVPSPMVWQKYIEYRRAAVNGAKPRRIAFRTKNEGWKRYSVSFSFDNDTEYRQTLDKDPMMQIFLKNLSLRKSCYHCAYKTKTRQSDITLADFWGIEKIHPEMDDDKGTSLMIIQTQKGMDILDKLKNNLTLKQTDFERAILYNSAMTKSVEQPRERTAFFETLTKDGFVGVNKKYLRVSFFKKCKKLLSKIKRKIVRR